MRVRNTFIDFPTVHLVASSYKIRHNVPAIVVRYFVVVQWQNKPLEKEKEGERKEREKKERTSAILYLTSLLSHAMYIKNRGYLV